MTHPPGGCTTFSVNPGTRARVPTHLVPLKQACHKLGITQAFSSYHIPKENADTERLMPTLKEE